MPTLKSQNESPEAAVATEMTLSQCAAEEDQDVVVEMEEEEESDVSEYEQTRERRIKENMERMKKLGIFDMSLQLKSAVLSSKPARKCKALNFKNTPVREADVLTRPTRRSFRLQNVTPVSYTEVAVERKGNSSRSRDIYHEVGSKPEVYTEEHDKLLGECNMTWTLFVDGYGKDGKRIYDPVRGKTCHQCRQKTLGHRTSCSKCNLVQGQFCGDCLYMRYGEHVLEANENPDWICPPCRGICNCSLCRQAKGWAPTGPLYRKIASLGYKSVAHYLFQTRRSQTNDDKTDPQNKTLSRKELPFADDVPSAKDDVGEVITQQPETHDGRSRSDNVKGEDVDMIADDGENGVSTELIGTCIHDGRGAERMEIAGNKHKSGLETVQANGRDVKYSKADVRNNSNENKHLTVNRKHPQWSPDYINTPEKTSTRKRRGIIVEPSPDSVAGRLKLRRKGLCNI